MFTRLIKEKRKKKNTGIEEIDSLCGGEIKSGDIVLLIEGEDVKYHIGMHRIFISQGLEDGDKCFYLSADYSSLSPPSVCTEPTETKTSMEKEKIAWRYKTISSTTAKREIFGMPESASKKYNLRSLHEKADALINVKYTDAEESMRDLFEKIDTYAKSKSSTSIRVSILSLFSPLWECTAEQRQKLLFMLRSKIRTSKAICMVSVPVYLLDDFCYGFFDIIFGLEKNTVPAIKCDGFIQCLKSSIYHYEKYAVHCSSTGIRMEKAILPPE